MLSVEVTRLYIFLPTFKVHFHVDFNGEQPVAIYFLKALETEIRSEIP